MQRRKAWKRNYSTTRNTKVLSIIGTGIDRPHQFSLQPRLPMRNVAGASRKGDLAARWNSWWKGEIIVGARDSHAKHPLHSEPTRQQPWNRRIAPIKLIPPFADSRLYLTPLSLSPLSSLLSPLTFKPRSDLRAARYHNVYPRPPGALQRGCLEVSLIFITPGYHRKEYSCIEFTFSGYTISGKFFADLKFENEVPST